VSPRKSSRAVKSPSEVYAQHTTGTEEDRLVKLAIKNSLFDASSGSKHILGLSDIPQMEVFRPTEEEFTDPIKYVEKLYAEGAHRFGTIKIVPPKSFQPPLAFDTNSKQLLPTRLQTLSHLGQGKVSV